MAFRERLVQGYVVDGDGVPITNARVKFKPTVPLGYTSTHVVVDREFEAMTDAQGHFSRTLWCDEDSLVAINYTVQFPIANGGQADASHLASFSLAYGDGSAIDIGTLISLGLPTPTPTELLYQSVDQRIGNRFSAYDADRPQPIPHALDDDFLGNALQPGYAQINSKNLNLSVGQSLLKIQQNAPAGSPLIGGIVKPIPGNLPSWTAVAKIYHLTYENNSATWVGIFIRSVSGNLCLSLTDRKDRVSFSRWQTENDLTKHLATLDKNNERLPVNFPMYLKIKYLPNYKYLPFFSYDGVAWCNLLGDDDSFFDVGINATEVGVCIVNENSMAAAKAAVDWFRFYPSEVDIIGG